LISLSTTLEESESFEPVCTANLSSRGIRWKRLGTGVLYQNFCYIYQDELLFLDFFFYIRRSYSFVRAKKLCSGTGHPRSMGHREVTGKQPRPVVPKVCCADSKGSATSSQRIRGYISVMVALKSA